MATPNPYRFKDYPMLDQDEPVLAKDLAQKLTDDYEEGLKKYSKKRMYVKGTVRYSGPDLYGLPSLELSDSGDGPIDCLCVFETPVNDYHKGDTVTVIGNFIGCAPKYGPTFKKCEVTDKE